MLSLSLSSVRSTQQLADNEAKETCSELVKEFKACNGMVLLVDAFIIMRSTSWLPPIGAMNHASHKYTTYNYYCVLIPAHTNTLAYTNTLTRLLVWSIMKRLLFVSSCHTHS